MCIGDHELRVRIIHWFCNNGLIILRKKKIYNQKTENKRKHFYFIFVTNEIIKDILKPFY